MGKSTKTRPAPPPEPAGHFRLVAQHPGFLGFFAQVHRTEGAALREVANDRSGTYNTHPKAVLVDADAARVVSALSATPEYAARVQASLDALVARARESKRRYPRCAGLVVCQPPAAPVPHCLRCSWEDEDERERLVELERAAAPAEASP
jgi:hypothetical protein